MRKLSIGSILHLAVGCGILDGHHDDVTDRCILLLAAAEEPKAHHSLGTGIVGHR